MAEDESEGEDHVDEDEDDMDDMDDESMDEQDDDEEESEYEDVNVSTRDSCSPRGRRCATFGSCGQGWTKLSRLRHGNKGWRHRGYLALQAHLPQRLPDTMAITCWHMSSMPACPIQKD